MRGHICFLVKFKSIGFLSFYLMLFEFFIKFFLSCLLLSLMAGIIGPLMSYFLNVHSRLSSKQFFKWIHHLFLNNEFFKISSSFGKQLSQKRG